MTLRCPGGVDLSKANWAMGQVYVTLSRFTSLHLITVLTSVSPQALTNVNHLAVSYYKAADCEAASWDAPSGAVAADAAAPTVDVDFDVDSTAAASSATATSAASASASASPAPPPGSQPGSTTLLSYDQLTHVDRGAIGGFLFFDAEHTGHNPFEGRMVSIGLSACSSDMTALGEWSSLLHPDNVNSTPRAQGVHRLTMQQLSSAPRQLAALDTMNAWIEETFKDVDSGVVLMAHNGFGTDFNFLCNSLWRVSRTLAPKVQWTGAGCFCGNGTLTNMFQVTHVIDTCKLARKQRDNGEPCGLVPLYTLATGEDMRASKDAKHDALEDTQALQVIFARLFQDQWKLRNEDLPCVAWSSMVEREGRRRVRSGLVAHSTEPYRDPSEDIDMLDASDGSSDTGSSDTGSSDTRPPPPGLLRPLHVLYSLCHGYYLGLSRRVLVRACVAIPNVDTRTATRGCQPLPWRLARAEVWLTEAVAAQFEHGVSSIKDSAAVFLATAYVHRLGSHGMLCALVSGAWRVPQRSPAS